VARRTTAGRCWRCKVIFQWAGRPLLKNALCPRCKKPLDRTAVSLVSHTPILEDEHPLELVRHWWDR
jgi:predicted amidophosphoribosyltransferase